MGIDHSKFDDKPDPQKQWQIDNYKYLSEIRKFLYDGLKGNIKSSKFSQINIVMMIKKMEKKIMKHKVERYVLLITIIDSDCELHHGSNPTPKPKKKEKIDCSDFIEGFIRSASYPEEFKQPFSYMIVSDKKIIGPKFKE